MKNNDQYSVIEMVSGRTVFFTIALFCLLILINTGKLFLYTKSKLTDMFYLIYVIGVEGSCLGWSPELGRYADGECRTSCFSHERNAGTSTCSKKWCCVTRI